MPLLRLRQHLPQLQLPRYRIKYLGLLAIGLSIFLHAFFAWHQPFTNDEGAYLYDARTILEGKVSAGDVLTKAPVPILLFTVGEAVTHKSVFAARIVNSIASIITVVPLFLLLQLVMNKRTAYIGAVLWLLGPGSIIFYTIGHTQAVASLFAVTCLYFFVRGFRVKSGMTSIFLAGVCFALAYMSRKTAIAVSVPLMLSWVVLRNTKDGLWSIIKPFLLGVISIVIPWVIWMYVLYGSSGVWHALGTGYGDIVVHSQSITPWAGSADRMFAESVLMGLIYGALLAVICIPVLPNHRVLIDASWVATLGILYWLWPTHLVEYLADFIPPIVLAGSVALGSLHGVRKQYILVGILLCISAWSLHSVYIRPWTGTFARSAVEESANFLQEHVPLAEEVFTAAVIVPYLSGHHVPFDLSHPQWYRYAFISEKDKDTFLPPYSAVEKIVDQQVSWVLRDQLTDYVYPDISFGAFQESMRFPNNTGYRQNPLRVYSKYEY